MNKQIYEKMRDIPVLFSTSIPAPLPGVQATAVTVEMMYVSDRPGRESEAEAHSQGAGPAPSSTVQAQVDAPQGTNILPSPISHGRHSITVQRVRLWSL